MLIVVCGSLFLRCSVVVLNDYQQRSVTVSSPHRRTDPCRFTALSLSWMSRKIETVSRFDIQYSASVARETYCGICKRERGTASILMIVETEPFPVSILNFERGNRKAKVTV